MDLNTLLICLLNVLIIFNIEVSSVTRRKMKFFLLNKKNVTGHYVTHLSIKQTARDLPEIWKVDVEHEITESEGSRTSDLKAILSVPPQLPADYKLIPGIGYYKFHKDPANSFDEAAEICTKEGGHLAIINSEKESNALIWTLSGYSGYTYIGFHDRLKEGEFITIFGQSLNSTGFNKWSSSYEPNGGTSENCGSFHSNGGMNDISCAAKIPFICEYDLSWVDD